MYSKKITGNTNTYGPSSKPNQPLVVPIRMRYILRNIKSILLLLTLLLDTQSHAQDSHTLESFDKEAFWQESVVPFINRDIDKIRDIVHFPLLGDWVFIMEIDKEKSELTIEDFFQNFDNLFTDEFIDSLLAHNPEHGEIYNNERDGLYEVLVSAGKETWIDGFKYESAVILRYWWIENRWKLAVIQGAG